MVRSQCDDLELLIQKQNVAIDEDTRNTYEKEKHHMVDVQNILIQPIGQGASRVMATQNQQHEQVDIDK